MTLIMHTQKSTFGLMSKAYELRQAFCVCNLNSSCIL